LSSPDNPQFDPPPLNVETHLSAPPDTYSIPPPETLQVPSSPRAGENPVWSGWDVLQIAGLSVLTLLIAQVIILIGAHQFAYPHESWQQVGQKPSLALLAQLLMYGAIAIYMILLVQLKYHVRFWPAIRWNWPRTAVFGFMGVGVLMLGLDFLGRFLPMPKTTPFDQFFDRPLDAYLTVAFAISLGPLMEELFFRGFLYPVLARRMGAFWGILLTALPFGLVHYLQYRSWAAVLIIVLVGVVLTTVRAVTKSVASSFLAHVGYNGTLMILAAWATDGFRHMDRAGVLILNPF